MFGESLKKVQWIFFVCVRARAWHENHVRCYFTSKFGEYSDTGPVKYCGIDIALAGLRQISMDTPNIRYKAFMQLSMVSYYDTKYFCAHI